MRVLSPASVLLLLCLCLLPLRPAAAQDGEKEPEEEEMELELEGALSTEGLTHIGVGTSQDSRIETIWVDFTWSTDPARRKSFRLDMGAPLEAFLVRGEDEFRMAADHLVVAILLIPSAGVLAGCAGCDAVVQGFLLAASPLLLPAVRPVGVWQPARWVGLGLGYDSEYVFLARDKGVTFRPFVGLRLDLGERFRLEGGYQRNWLWNWRRDSEDLGGGWFAQAAVNVHWGEAPAPAP